MLDPIRSEASPSGPRTLWPPSANTFGWTQPLDGGRDFVFSLTDERHDRFPDTTSAPSHYCMTDNVGIESPSTMLRVASLIMLWLALATHTLAFAPSSSQRTLRVSAVPTSIPSPWISSPLPSWKPQYMSAAEVSGEGEEDSSKAAEIQKEEAKEVIPPGQATVQQLCFNLVKGVVGAGVLSLPAGIAAFATAPSAIVPAVALIASIGALSGYGFALIGRCCAYTNTKSYRDAWSATVGQKTSFIPAMAVTLKTFAAILAYSMILGDTFVSLFVTAGFNVAKVPTLLGVTSFVLLPLCLLKNLASLAPFSLVGSLGMIYTAVAMTIRYLGKSYVAPVGKFATDCAPALRPSFGSVGAEGILTPSAAILVGMLSTAYMAHFNAPKVNLPEWKMK